MRVDIRYRMQDAGFRIKDAELKEIDRRYNIRIPDTGIQDAELRR